MDNPVLRFIFGIYFHVWYWWIFRKYRNSLPTRFNNPKPKLEYEALAQAFYWEDEGLLEAPYHLGQAFRYVIVHRTQLLVGNECDAGCLLSKRFDRILFNRAKKYFPDWIGFQDSRCTPNPELANRLMRIRVVAEWQMDKMFDDESYKAKN